MRKISNKIFLNKCDEIHNNKYDYSLVNYKKAKDKIKIICSIHGIFEQIAFHHKKGKGCPKCSHDKLRNNNFIQEFNKIHNNKYDYSLVKYKNNRTKIKIICPNHGVFEQVPQSHLNGFGCKKCSIEGGAGKHMHTKEKFIEKAFNVHGNKYDYSLVNYKGSDIKIKIVCSTHGVFEQTPRHHLYDRGCPKCNFSKGELFIDNFLKEKNILYYSQYSFKECRDILPLPFDFYLPDYNLCIEFDGIQHFEEVKYWGGIDYLNDVKKKDIIKNIYCSKNNIDLMRIKYNENIKNELNNYEPKQSKNWKQKISTG